MNETKQEVKAVQKADREVSYMPHGSSDVVKLNATIVQKFLCTPTKSGSLCSDRDAMRFIMLCVAKRLNPFEGDAFLVGYDSKDGPVFSQITAHQAFLKRAETHPEYDGMESGVVVQDGEDGEIKDQQGDFMGHGQILLGGWAKVHFKNRKVPTYRRLNLEARAKKVNGQLTKFWDDDTAGMIVKCAEADALRSSFPTMLGGLYMREEQTINSHPMDFAGSSAKQVAATVQDDSNPDLMPQKEPKTPPQQQLADIIIQAGFTFDGYREFWRKEGPENIKCDDWQSFDDVPADWASRHVKAKTGMLKAMEQLKGGV